MKQTKESAVTAPPNGDDGGPQKSALTAIWDVVKRPFDKNEKELRKLQPLLERVNSLGPKLKEMSDDELKSMSDELRRRFREMVTQRLRERGADWREPNFDPLGIDQEYERLRRAVEKGVLDELSAEAFALVREVSERTIQLRPYDVQILGAAVLHSGRISEMKTGEGKTLVATMPVYLNALTGRGVHVVTVNDYLAERDANWMRPIYEFLGLTVAYITNGSTTEERKIAYRCDVLYATNSEVGFDYLRDNMALDPDEITQRPLNFGIVDEVDNILIDEARTPLIISAQVEQSDRARRKRTHAKACDVVARKVMPATTDRDVEDLINRHTQGGGIDVEGLLGVILKNGCLTTAVRYLIESYVRPDSPARAENVAKLLDLVDELHGYQLVGPEAQSRLVRLATQAASDQEIADAIDEEVQRTARPFGVALSRVLEAFGIHEDKEDQIAACRRALSASLHINPDFLDPIEDRLRESEDDLAFRFAITSAVLEECARRQWIEEDHVRTLAEGLYEVEPAAAEEKLVEQLMQSEGRLALALSLADELDDLSENRDADGSEDLSEAVRHNFEETIRQKVAVIEKVSTEGLLPHSACERLWELVRIHAPHEELIRNITSAIQEESGANARAIRSQVAEFAKERQQWLRTQADQLRNELSSAKSIGKSSVDVLYQNARAGASPDDLRRILRQELYRFSPNAEVLKSVRTFAQQRSREMEQLATNLVRDLDELVELPKTTRRTIQMALVGGGHADLVRKELHSLVSDLPDESREAENVVAHAVNGLVKWREEKGDAFVDELAALVPLPVESQTAISTAVHDGAPLEQMESIVAEELLKLPDNEQIAGFIQSFSEDWRSWLDSRSDQLLDRLSQLINLSDDLRQVLRGHISSSQIQAQELPSRCLESIATDLIGRHLEPLLTPESADAFVEELKRRIPLEKKLLNRISSDAFVGKNQEQLERTVIRLVQETLRAIPTEDFKRFVKSYGWFSEKEEKSHAAAITDMGTLIAEREIADPSFPDPEDFLRVLTENGVLREEEAAMVEQAMDESSQRQVSVIVPQVIALDPARRRKLAELKMQEVQTVLDQSVKAHALYHKDVHYVIEGGTEIVIVDEFTGRKMPGRRWSDGLHEAVEAKEHLEVRLESQTVATVTIQNYFRLYHKLAGMTGTAKTEEAEFVKTYGLEVVSIPTNKPVRRKDHADVIFKTAEAKTRSICFEILELYCKGQPVLVGTRSVEVSERLSERLKAQHLQTLCLSQLIKLKLWDDKQMDGKQRDAIVAALNVPLPQLNVASVRGVARDHGIAPDVTATSNLQQIRERMNLSDEHMARLEAALKGGIPLNVLNAKNHRNEARIIAEAARVGAVTIATNMAGRGVDILLGGTLDNEAKLRVITRQLGGRRLRGEFSRVRSRTIETTETLLRRLSPHMLQQLAWINRIDDRLNSLQREKQIDSATAKEIRDAYAADPTSSELRSRVRARARRLNINALLPLDDDVTGTNATGVTGGTFWAPEASPKQVSEILENGVIAYPYRIDPRDSLLLQALFHLADREDRCVYHLVCELTSLPDLDHALMDTVAHTSALRSNGWDAERLAQEMRDRNPQAMPVTPQWILDRLEAFEIHDPDAARRWLASATSSEIELNDAQILEAVRAQINEERLDRSWLQQKLRVLNLVRSERRYNDLDDKVFVHLRIEREALDRLAGMVNGNGRNGLSSSQKTNSARWARTSDERLKLSDTEISNNEIVTLIRELDPQSIWATPEWVENRLLELGLVQSQEIRVLPPREGERVPTVRYRLRPQQLLALLDERLIEALMNTLQDSSRDAIDPERISRTLIEGLPEISPWVDDDWIARRLESLGYGSQRDGRFIVRQDSIPHVLIETGVAGQAADWVLLGEKRPEDVVQTSEAMEVKQFGGLHILGTERHESRRIDNQLRGRAGRQGDPGSSRFYVSLEDELWRLFGVRGKWLLDKWQEDEPVESRVISKQIENAQKKVELNHFEARKHTLQYDDVMNVQREAIYKMRRKALLGVGLRETTLTMISDAMKTIHDRHCPPQLREEEWDFRRMFQALAKLYGSERINDYVHEADLRYKSRNELHELLTDALTRAYEKREAEMGPESMRELERYQICDTIGDYWMQHLAEMELLREGINLRAWGQREPLLEYRKEAYDLFQVMKTNIQNDTIEFLMSVPVDAAVEWAGRRLRSRISSMRYQWSETAENGAGQVETYTHSTLKVGRNDPCPCGSGKKYKQCCLKKQRRGEM